MTKTAYNAWLNDYREVLTQAAGIAYILGFSDHAKTLHTLSCQAMGIDTTANKRQKDIDEPQEMRYHKGNQAENTPMEKKREVEKMYKWVEIYSIDMCIPDGMTAKVKATYNETEKAYEISRHAFLQACKKIGTDEHAARCTENVYTQTGRKEGSQWYNLKDGIRPLTW